MEKHFKRLRWGVIAVAALVAVTATAAAVGGTSAKTGGDQWNLNKDGVLTVDRKSVV